jgi:purine-binding chemotaxis protein CheW
MDVLLCRIDGVTYALRTTDVVEVVRAAAVVPVPGAPDVVLGLLDLRGAPVAVLDGRRRFGHPPRSIDPTERFVVAQAADRRVALRVDAAESIATLDEAAIEDPARHAVGARHVEGVVALGDGLVLVHDVTRFLAATEAEALDAALAAQGARGDGATT